MKRYLITLCLYLLFFVGSVGLFNYYVDPLVIYRADTAIPDKINRLDQFYNMRLYKPKHISQLQPQAVIIGTSRAGAIRPDSQVWPGLSTYNYSQPGLTLYEMARSIQHAHVQGPLSKVMIGLDFGAFVHMGPLFRNGFAEARLAKDSSDIYMPGYLLQQLKDLRLTLFSLYITNESIEAVAPPEPRNRYFFDDGSWKNISNKLTGRSGYAFVAKGKVSEMKREGLGAKHSLEIFRGLLEFLYANNIEAKFFFTPTHVFFVDLWFRLGVEQMWYDVHYDVLSLNEGMAKEYGRQPFDMWGFGNEEDIVTEPIYRSVDAEKAWFSDGVHYDYKLAEMIKLAMWRDKEKFGEKLSSDTVNDYLSDINRMRSKFLNSNKKLINKLYSKIDHSL